MVGFEVGVCGGVCVCVCVCLCVCLCVCAWWGGKEEWKHAQDPMDIAEEVFKFIAGTQDCSFRFTFFLSFFSKNISIYLYIYIYIYYSHHSPKCGFSF